MIEAEGELIASAKLYVDQRSSVLREAGDVQDPIARGLITADHIQAELGDLCRGEELDLACASLAWHNLGARRNVGPAANRYLSAKLRVFADWAVEAFAARLGTTKFSGDKSLRR
jgi:hypothetical protein